MKKQQHKPRRGQKPAIVPKKNRVGWVVAGALSVAGVVALVKYNSSPGSASNSGTSQPQAAAAASPFGATMPNKTPTPAAAREGMLWISGGEFSMGSDASSETLCGLPGVTRDALLF